MYVRIYACAAIHSDINKMGTVGFLIGVFVQNSVLCIPMHKIHVATYIVYGSITLMLVSKTQTTSFNQNTITHQAFI